MSEERNEVHIKTYDEWLKYYKNATKEQVIEDLTRDVQYFADAVKDIKDLQQKVEQLEKENKILKENAEHNDKVVDKVNMSKEILYIDDGELVYYISENEFITCDGIPMPMLEEIKHLQQKVEQLENIRKEAIKLLKKCGIVDVKGNFNAYLDTIELNDLLNILNKGSE